MKTLTYLTAAAVLSFIPALAPAADRPAAPGQVAQPAPAQVGQNPQPATLQIKVLAVKGLVEYRTDSTAKWAPLTVDSKLTPGSQISTGPHSSAELMVGPAHVLLRRLGIITLAQLSRDKNNTVRTLIGKRYGSLEADIKHAGDLKTDVRIATPSSVLAMRGTGVDDTQYGDQQTTTCTDGHIDQFPTNGQSNSMQQGDTSTNDNPNPDNHTIVITNIDNTSGPGNAPTDDPNSGYFGGPSTPQQTYNASQNNSHNDATNNTYQPHGNGGEP